MCELVLLSKKYYKGHKTTLGSLGVYNKKNEISIYSWLSYFLCENGKIPKVL
jgi:hypothetical protein